MPTRRSISASEAYQLLRAIRGVSFVDNRYYWNVSSVLTELAFWDPRHHHHDTAVAWIERLYQEVKNLPPNHPIYGKALRRLRTICGRTDPLPATFEFHGYLHIHGRVSTPGTANSDVFYATCGHQAYAVKQIRADHYQRPGMRRAFHKEAIVWMLFRHPNIVPFLGVRRAGPYAPVDLISKWMVYGELTRFLRKNPQEDPLRYIGHIISGLRFIHSLEMVHADLKGRNVLVDEHYHACIADFGHTVTMQRTGLPTSHVDGNSGGTIAFMAPELLDSDGFGTPGEPTAASDIYALAILIWEIFAGCDPYRINETAIMLQVTKRGLRPKRENAPRLQNHHYDALWNAIQRAWSQNPRQRGSLNDIEYVLR